MSPLYNTHRSRNVCTKVKYKYLMMRVVGWIDTYQVLVLFYTTSNLPFVIWML
jgi:ABC-type maltose transport system permease subunit